MSTNQAPTKQKASIDLSKVGKSTLRIIYGSDPLLFMVWRWRYGIPCLHPTLLHHKTAVNTCGADNLLGNHDSSAFLQYKQLVTSVSFAAHQVESGDLHLDLDINHGAEYFFADY